MRRPFPWLVLLPLLLIPLTACGSTGPDASITGAYALFAVDGNLVPWTQSDDGTTRVRVMGGTIYLVADGSFSDHAVYEVTKNGVASQQLEDNYGTFDATSDGATLTYDNFGPVDVQIANGTMTQVVGTDTWVYRK